MSKNFVRKTSANKNQINLSSKSKIQIKASFQSETVKFDKFQVVWAKISGYPWWPALVTELSDQKNLHNSKNPQRKKLKNLIADSNAPWDYRVDFIADETHAYLKKNYLLKFQQNRDRLVTEGFTFARRKARFFEAAINQADQIHQAVQASKKQLKKKSEKDSQSDSEEIMENQNNQSLYESGLIEERQQKNYEVESSEQKQLQNYIKLQLDQDLNQNMNESIIVSSQGDRKHPLEDLTHHLSNQTTQNRRQTSKSSPQTKPQKIIPSGQFSLTYSQIINQETTVNNLLKKYQLDMIPDLLLKLKQHKKIQNLKKKSCGLNLKTNTISFPLLEFNSFHDDNNVQNSINGHKIKGSLSNKINLALKRGRKPNIKIIHKSQFADITFINKLKDSDISQSKRIKLYELCQRLTARKLFSMCKYKICSSKSNIQSSINNDQKIIDYLRFFSFSIANSYFNTQNDQNNSIGNLYKKVNECIKFLNVFKNQKWMKKNCEQLFGSERYLLLQNLRQKLQRIGINPVDQNCLLEQICKVDENQRTNFITPSNQINSLMQQQNAQVYNQNMRNEMNISDNIVSI